jgi:hypothetical protein
MLKSLDEKGQVGFYEKYKDCWAIKQNSEIDIRDVKNYISSRHHNKLYKFIMVKECQTCPKRTYFTDKGLFPELLSAEDACLDHECYLKRWSSLIGAKIRNCKTDNPTHAEAKILVVDSKIKKYLDKTPTFADVAYEVRATGHYDDGCTDKPGKASVPCIRIELDYSNNFKTSVKYLKSLEKEKLTSASHRAKDRYEYFEPVIKLLELPAEEAKLTVEAWTKGKKETWEFNQKVSDLQRNVQKALHAKMVGKMEKNPNEKSFEFFIEEFIENFNEDVFASVAGSLKTEELKKLSSTILFTAMYAATIKSHRLPNFDDFSKPIKKNNILDWAGISIQELKAIYKEELQKLMPKVEAKPTEEKSAKKQVKKVGSSKKEKIKT